MFLVLGQHSNQAYRSLIAGMLIKIATGIVTIWGNTNIYYLSFLLSRGLPISKDSNSRILLFSILPISIIALMATKLSNRFGSERVIRVCAVMSFLSPFMLNFVDEIWQMALFLTVIPGAAFAVSSIPLLSILWAHFPENRGKVTSILVVVFSVSGIMWNYLFVMLVNPRNQPGSVEVEGMRYFGNEVTENLMQTNNILSFITGLCFVSGSIMISKPKHQQPQQHQPIQLSSQLPSPTQTDTDKIIVTPTGKPLLQLVLTPNFLLIYSCSLLHSLFTAYCLTNFKLIFLPILNDDHFLTYILVGYSAVSLVGTFYWGGLADRKGFAATFVRLVMVDAVVKLGLWVVGGGRFGVLGYFLVIGFFDKGMMTIVGPGLVELYGIEGGTELLPLKGSSMLLTFAVVPVIQILTKEILTPLELLKIFSIVNVLGIIPAIMLWRLNRK